MKRPGSVTRLRARRTGHRLAPVLAALVLTAGCSPVLSAAPSSAPATTPVPATTGSGAPSTSTPTGPVGDGPPPSSGASTSPGGSSSVDPTFTVQAADLADDAPDEASGLLTLPGTDPTGVPGRYLTVDDDDGPLELVAVDQAGGVVGRTRVDGVTAVNPEALAVGSCPEGSCVYVGDIGFTQRRTVTVHRLPLAGLATTGTADQPADASVAAESWDFRWPDGPLDAEGMLVEPDGSVLIVEKTRNDRESRPARLFRGPAGGGDLTAVGEVTVPPPTVPMRTLLTGNVVTDATADDDRVLLLTYDQVIEYTDPQGRALDHLADFPTWPSRNLPLPPSEQAEGVSATPDGCGYAVISEAGPGGWRSAGRLSISTCG